MKILARWVSIFIFLTAFVLTGCANKTEEKRYRVGILSGIDYLLPTVDGFQEKMTELGYIEGKNIAYQVRKTNFDPPEEKRILEKWAAEKVDLIVTSPTEVSLEAKSVTKGTGIPVLFANAFIEGSDLIDTIRNPGGEVTGIRYPAPDIAIKSLEILLEVAPRAKRIWLPYLDGAPTVQSQLDALRKAAKVYGITLSEFPTHSAAEIKAELDKRKELADPGIDAIMHIAEPVATWSDVAEVISNFVVERKLAYHGTSGKCVIILTIDSYTVGKQAALLADKILKGIPAGTIPVVSADPVLTINYTVAQELGLTVPEGLLLRADRIL